MINKKKDLMQVTVVLDKPFCVKLPCYISAYFMDNQGSMMDELIIDDLYEDLSSKVALEFFIEKHVLLNLPAKGCIYLYNDDTANLELVDYQFSINVLLSPQCPKTT